MAEFKVFVGRMEKNAKNKGLCPIRVCEDICCRNFREARTKALALYKEKRAGAQDLFAFVLCDDPALFIGSGIRPASVKNFGNGYCVDVTPSRLLPVERAASP